MISEARRSAQIFGFIFIDLDQFKQVNDQYGHQVGDMYLQEAALRMKHQLRLGDTLARLGGDEFAVVVAAVHNRSDVHEIAHRLEHSFDNPFAVGGHVVRGSASIGVALYPEDADSADSLLKTADAAMYLVKQSRSGAKAAATNTTASSLPVQKTRIRRPGFWPGLELLTVRDEPALLRRHLLGLAFLPHQFQLALGGFDLGVHFLLHASRGLFELR